MGMNDKEFKKIEFYLYNYKNIDKLIDEEVEKYINNTNTSINTWLKGLNNFNNTVENQAIRIANDPKILELKKWKAFLTRMFIFLQQKKKSYYIYIKCRYLYKMTDEEIRKIIKMNELKDLRLKVINYIYNKAAEMRIL